MRFHKRNLRSRKLLTDRNVNMLELSAAVMRADRTGVFLMSERSDEGGFEGADNGLDIANSINHLSKVDTALRGLDAARGVLTAPPADSKPRNEPSPSAE